MKEHIFKIEVGVKAKSNISGFSGMITARCQHVNGCDRYLINPLVKKDGKLPDGYWFDEGELKVDTKTKRIKPQNQDNGGFHSKIK